MTLLVSRLGGAYDRYAAYVYVLASVRHRVVYVGETHDPAGAVGRAGAHLAPGGTFTERFEDEVGLPAEEATDLTLLSARLPQTPEFTGVERSYRQGVEYLVQTGLRTHPARLRLRYAMLAGMYGSTARVSEPEVVRLAEGIVSDVLALYPTLM